MVRKIWPLICMKLTHYTENEGLLYRYLEKNVPSYTLPPLLKAKDGTFITDEKEWFIKRRPEILEDFKEYVYGHSPPPPKNLEYEVNSVDYNAVRGKGIRKEIKINIAPSPEIHHLNLLLYLPKHVSKPVPVILGYNFYGNHTIRNDKKISLPDSKKWLPFSLKFRVFSHKAKKGQRGILHKRYPIKWLFKNGYGLATIYYGDVYPDYSNGIMKSIIKYYLKEGETKPKENEWGAIGAWAWGLSRAMDYLERDSDIDSSRVALFGHSRLAKTALWAGAQDQRFAMVIANNSGCGGAALSRRKFGETIFLINKIFPHWFNKNFHRFSDNEDLLPVDQHMLLALIAPRPLYISIANRDLWSDPKGMILATKAADKVYKLLGSSGLPQNEPFKINKPIFDSLGYHVRSGRHNIHKFDWRQFIKFMNKHFKTRKEPKKLLSSIKTL